MRTCRAHKLPPASPCPQPHRHHKPGPPDTTTTKKSVHPTPFCSRMMQQDLKNEKAAEESTAYCVLVRLAGIEKRPAPFMVTRFFLYRLLKYRQKYRQFILCQRFDPRCSKIRRSKSVKVEELQKLNMESLPKPYDGQSHSRLRRGQPQAGKPVSRIACRNPGVKRTPCTSYNSSWPPSGTNSLASSSVNALPRSSFSAE